MFRKLWYYFCIVSTIFGVMYIISNGCFIGGGSTKSVLSDRWIVYTKSRKQLLHRKYLLYETGCTFLLDISITIREHVKKNYICTCPLKEVGRGGGVVPCPLRYATFFLKYKEYRLLWNIRICKINILK